MKALGSGLAFPLTAIEAWTGNLEPIRAHGLEIRSLAFASGRSVAVAVRVQAEEAVTIEPVVELSAP